MWAAQLVVSMAVQQSIADRRDGRLRKGSRDGSRERSGASAPAVRCEAHDPDGRPCSKPADHLLPHVSVLPSGDHAHAWPRRRPDQALLRVEADGTITLLDDARVTVHDDYVRVDYPRGSEWGGSFIARRDSTHSCEAFGTRSTCEEILRAAERQGIAVD